MAAVFAAGPRLVAAALAVGGVAVAVAVAVVAALGAPPPPELTIPRADHAGAPAPPGGPSGAEQVTVGAGEVTAGGGGALGEGAVGEAAPAEPDPEVYVHVAGAVARPGVYRVRAGGRVADVVDAAGGPRAEADVDQLNLAARVSDGEKVYVPRRGELPPGGAPAGAAAGTGGSGAAAASGPVDLNTATLEQLDALPGVGPATAQAIVDYRREHGRFSQVQELLEVRGIGEARLAALRSRVRV